MKKAQTAHKCSKVIISLLFVCFSLNGIGQNPTLLRQTLSQTGGSAGIQLDSHSFYVQQSIGQGSTIGSSNGEKLTLRQGFIQPDKFQVRAINIESETINISVYPNPFNQELILELDDNLEQNLSIQIFDIAGRLVFSEQHSPSTIIKIQTPKLSKGSYIIYLASGNKKFTQNLQKL